MKTSIDNFSQGSNDYAKFRPGSPEGVFDFLYSHIEAWDHAWDCGTGNGQVAIKLADRFAQVTATDISEQQLAAAPKRPNIQYNLERTEATTLPHSSVDLVTVAQAIHWFDFDAFYAEVKRVCKPGALVAAWTYVGLKISPEADAVIDKLYTDITGNYWDKERRYVDDLYESIPFPFDEIATPMFGISKAITIESLLGYLRTWSGVKHYNTATGEDAVTLVEKELRQAWGNAATREVHWPVHMRAGRV